MYKVVNKIAPEYIHELFQIHNIKYGIRDNNRLTQFRYDTAKYGFKSIKYLGVKLWNDLPVEVKNTENLAILKNLIKNWRCKSPELLC